MKNNTRILISFLRIKLSNNLRSIFKSLPLEDFEEFSRGNNIYYGKGKIRHQNRSHKATIRILPKKGSLSFLLRLDDLGREAEFPIKMGNINTLPNEVWKFLNRLLN